MNHSPFLSLIIPCHNALPYLSTCVESLKKQGFQNWELIVIDNGSTDGLKEWIRNQSFSFPFLFSRNEINPGYAAGVNQGAANCRGEIIVVLNSDLTFESVFLENIVLGFRNTGLEMAALHVKNKEGTKTESLGVYLTSFLRGKNSTTGSDILGPSGTAFALKKNLLKKISTPNGLLYDERYFFLWEDIELSCRLSKLGIATGVIENAVCFHHGNSSRSGYFYKQYLSLRNRFYLIRTYYPAYRRTHWMAMVFYDLPRLLFFLLFNPYRLRWIKEELLNKKLFIETMEDT
ncbi:MAG: glycosyltransferase [Candidatus Aureabacteria bacterium]|nr:glycosyltransferase [Candidatus Auribacterota bacterium]